MVRSFGFVSGFYRTVRFVFVAMTFAMLASAGAAACQVQIGPHLFGLGGQAEGSNRQTCVPGELFHFEPSQNRWVAMLDGDGNPMKIRDMKGIMTPWGPLLIAIEETSGALVMRYGLPSAIFYANTSNARGFLAYKDQQLVYPDGLGSIDVLGSTLSVNVRLPQNQLCTTAADLSGAFHWQWNCVEEAIAQPPLPAGQLGLAGLTSVPVLRDPHAHNTFVQFFQQIQSAVRGRDIDYLSATVGFNFFTERDEFGTPADPNASPDVNFRKILHDYGWETFDQIMLAQSGSDHPERGGQVCAPSMRSPDYWQHHHLCFERQDGGEWKITSFVFAGD